MTRRVDNLTIISASWGDYFETFGDGWLKSLAALDPQPAHIVVATDRTLPLPSHFEQVPIRKPYFWESVNCAVEAAQTEWIAGLMLDDRQPPDALEDIDMTEDVEASIAIDSNGRPMRPQLARWNDIMDREWFPLSGYQIIKRDVFLRFPYRPVEWPDWIQALEWKAAGVRVRFSERVRQHYTLHPRQNSRPADMKVALDRIDLVKSMIRNGGIKPGNVWPPEAA